VFDDVPTQYEVEPRHRRGKSLNITQDLFVEVGIAIKLPLRDVDADKLAICWQLNSRQRSAARFKYSGLALPGKQSINSVLNAGHWVAMPTT